MTKFVNSVIVFAVSLLFLLFSSCAQVPKGSDTSNLNGSSGSVNTLTQTKLISINNGSSSAVNWAISDDGLYEISNILGSYNIIYSDFERERAFFLCANVGCDHGNDSCTSYLPANGWLFDQGEHLYYISFNMADTWGDYHQVYYVMDKAGNNRRLIYESYGDYIYSGANVCVNDEYMYTFLENTNGRYLCRIDLKKGVCEQLREVKDTEWIVSAFDNYLVIRYLDEYDRTKYLGAVTSGLKLFNIDTLEDRSILKFDKVDFQETKFGNRIMYMPVTGTSCVYDGNVLYYMNNKDFVIHVFDLRTNSELTSYDVSELGDGRQYGLVHVHDGFAYLSYSMSLSELPRYLVVDLASGKYAKKDYVQFNQRYKKDELIYPIGFSNDKILFWSGGVDYTIQRLLPDGSYEVDSLPMPTVAYIPMSNYFEPVDNIHIMAFES